MLFTLTPALSLRERGSDGWCSCLSSLLHFPVRPIVVGAGLLRQPLCGCKTCPYKLLMLFPVEGEGIIYPAMNLRWRSAAARRWGPTFLTPMFSILSRTM